MSSDNQRYLRSDHNRGSNRLDELKRRRRKVEKYKSGIKREKKSEVFDSKGVHINSGDDLCDCLDPRCNGCFFKCPNKRCKSNKCGPDCRQKRKFYYESIEDPIDDTKRTNHICIRFDDTLDVRHIS